MKDREQMNIVIIGHVDHGKSTVIGRLLADTGSLPDGKLEAVKDYCKKNSRAFEYAYLLDALKDEQAQGITIDTARCFFKTSLRDYIIIDAPGHIEFLKNMVTGASRAEIALLVIDAKEGIKENSKRHGHIAAMLGIKQLVVLVNKMDLVDFDKEVFDNITEEFSRFLKRINIEPVNFIPISAFHGDNITQQSKQANWYEGPTVLEQLDEFVTRKPSHELPFRFPVQDIYKFTQKGDDRRIVAGTVLSGTLFVGDQVQFLPSGKKSTVVGIEGFNVKTKDYVVADEATGFTLSTQIYIKPGEMMVKLDENQPISSSRFKVNLFWVGQAPLIKNKNYKLKIGTSNISVKLVDIINIIDAAELNIDTFKDQVERHDVAECIFETAKPIVFDLITTLDKTGRFVIVDNYEISGGGIIIGSVDSGDTVLSEHVETREFLWEKSYITQADRIAQNKHESKFIVLTSGNEGNEIVIEQIGKELENHLFKQDFKAYYLGVSNLINGLAYENIATYNSRENHIEQIGELARLFTDSGQIFITSIFNLDDYEIEKLRLLNQPNEIIVVNIGESSFTNFLPNIIVDEDRAVESTLNYLRNQEVILEYYI